LRILHTSDWHLGRQFHGIALDDDHAAMLDQVEAAIAAHRPDLLIIAGDIFDRPSPPQAALKRFGEFLTRISQDPNLAIGMIAGNHDSPAQIAMMSVLPTAGRTLVGGPIDRNSQPLLLSDSHGVVAVSALPFSYEFAARACFEDPAIACPADVMRAQLEAARTTVPEGARWIVIAHAFVAGATSSEGERPLSRAVGGIETVPADLFAGAHYVALGHLHRPQRAGADHIRYSGAPLAFGLDEAGDIKSLTLADLAADGSVSIQLLPLKPLREVRVVRGRLSELIEAPAICHDYTGVTLTDEVIQVDAMKRIRAVYPNAVQLNYAELRARGSVDRTEIDHALKDPKAVVAGFLDAVRQDGLSDTEAAIIDTALAGLAQDQQS
jgi:exonuclease SbcD